MAEQSEEIVAHLFRAEYGKLLATLTRYFGPSYLELAEDVVQETLISALSDWAVNGIPDNPTAWLIQVGKRKALNELKRNKMADSHHALITTNEGLSDGEREVFLEGEIVDSQLRMIFTCCDPNLNVESQIALTLKTLCGFGVKEVASALLTTESTINKRLYRAKEKFRETNTGFEIPQGEQLIQQLDSVCLTLYLLFNEGYNSSTGDAVIRRDLCLEALRLVKLLVDQFPRHGKLNALLSLMCFHIARFDSRIDDHGAIVLFEDQDRSKWNRELIAYGMINLQHSLKDDSLSAYHIEARIAAEHCNAESFEQTDWELLHSQYELLAAIKPNPIIQLNLAVIQSQLEGYETSLKLLAGLTGEKELNSYHLLPATQGIFCMKLEKYEEAISYLERALTLKPSSAERDYIQKKIIECKKNSLSN